MLQNLQEWELYVVLGIFLLMDLVVLVVWIIIDPLYKELEVFPHERPQDMDMDVVLQPQLEHCTSKHLNVWLGK